MVEVRENSEFLGSSIDPPQSCNDVVANHKWLVSHGRDYPGKWIALRNGQLISSSERLLTLCQRIEEEGLLMGDVLVFQLGSDDTLP